MIKQIFKKLAECFSFWKGLFLAPDKSGFIKSNKDILKTQVIVLLSCLLIGYVFYNAMRPAVKAVCRFVLRTDEDMDLLGEGRIIGVEAKKVVIGKTLRQVKSIGVLKANAEVMIKSEISGKIKEIRFKEGGEVEAGQVLIIFEDENFVAERNRIRAAYNLSKTEFERSKKLLEQKVSSLKTYDEAFAKMNELEAQLAGAEFNLSKTVIKAPFSGTIGIMKVAPGNIVQHLTELVSIVDNSPIKVEFMIPVKNIEDVAEGQSVNITVDAFKDTVFPGVVEAMDSAVNTRSHSMLLRATVPNDNRSLKHGMFANVSLITGEKEGVMLVDEDALDRDGSIEYVWTVDEKMRAHKSRVLTGAKSDSGVEILDGLKPETIVVVAGQLKLSEGAKVNILNIKDIKGVEENVEENKEEKEDEVKKNEKGKVKKGKAAPDTAEGKDKKEQDKQKKEQEKEEEEQDKEEQDKGSEEDDESEENDSESYDEGSDNTQSEKGR
jgi:membrane fusion protein (multidrug efflux system)